MKVLVVGGAGYIGSAMTEKLLEAGHEVTVFDNLSTGHRQFVPKKALFVKGDLRKLSDVKKLFRARKFDAVMHFAASALVGESVADPFKYYENNVLACLHLLKVMREKKVRLFIFSSTCATFGEPKNIPIKDDDEQNPVNPYGRSKLMIEKVLDDLSHKGDIRHITLRYFNACGAAASGKCGERHDPETHLIPNVLKAASGKKKGLVIFGNDYDTPDGTCARDYIHISDIVEAHLLALNALKKGMKSDFFNLGNGNGYSVMEIVAEAEKITGKKINVKVGPRRPGDPARLVGDASKAARVLGWCPTRDLGEIIRSAWAWEISRPAVRLR